MMDAMLGGCGGGGGGGGGSQGARGGWASQAEGKSGDLCYMHEANPRDGVTTSPKAVCTAHTCRAHQQQSHTCSRHACTHSSPSWAPAGMSHFTQTSCTQSWLGGCCCWPAMFAAGAVTEAMQSAVATCPKADIRLNAVSGKQLALPPESSLVFLLFPCYWKQWKDWNKT